MPEATIRIAGFTYYREVDDPGDPNRTIRQSAFARRGETVELSDEDYERGKDMNAFGDPDSAAAAPTGERSVVDMSDDELVSWLEDESPNVQETVAAAQDDPESAQRLLDAEESATGGDPRQGVVDGLTKIIEE